MEFKYITAVLLLLWKLAASILANPIILNDVTSTENGTGNILTRRLQSFVQDDNCPEGEKRLPFRPPLNSCVTLKDYQEIMAEYNKVDDDYIN